jgi:hypothetical protein
MAFKKSFKKSKNDKYLRLTGLWPSKNNDDLATGRVKADEVDALIEKFQEASEAGAPIVFSLWKNEQESRKDPKFTLQCFVGDAEEEPQSNRKFKKSSKRNEEEEEDGNEEDNEETDTNQEEDDDKEERSSKSKSSSKKSSKRSSGW